jgi:hypothetical protein
VPKNLIPVLEHLVPENFEQERALTVPKSVPKEFGAARAEIIVTATGRGCSDQHFSIFETIGDNKMLTPPETG